MVVPESHDSGSPAGEPCQHSSELMRLWREPDMHHIPEDYSDISIDYHPALFSALERFLPPDLLTATREAKLIHMTDVLSSYVPREEPKRRRRHAEYRDRIMKNYRPLHPELYTLNPDRFFVKSFLDAIKDNTQESFRGIISELLPGIYTFSMFQPWFCESLVAEVENFKMWVDVSRLKITKPTAMSDQGAVLDEVGFQPMLHQIMVEFITPMAAVFFSDFLGSSLDSHHGFVVEYGEGRALDLGFHVDESEVTLNVCLGKQFTGGDIFFRGVRCEKHLNRDTYADEFMEYSHVPGQALLHAGRHRHGARAVTSGYRINLIMWCRSSAFAELKKHQREFSWCGECSHQKGTRQREIFVAMAEELLQME